MSLPPAILLVGGLGTRLRELYADRPKALVPIHGRPFLAHQLERLRDQGVQRVHLAAGYRGDMLKAWIENAPHPDMVLSASVEPEPLGTGGGLRYALDQAELPEGPCFVLNGDSLLPEATLSAFVDAAAKRQDIPLWMAAVEMTERGQYGTLDVSDDGRILAFREKADHDRGWVNGGIYLIMPGLTDLLPTEGFCSLEKDLFPRLAEVGRIGAIRVPGPLLDMGTPAGIAVMEDRLGGG